MNEITLTIGIPTYNRCNFLKKLINNLLNQLQKIDNSKIEILISDNCSTDNTEDLIKKILKKSTLKIRYIKNSKNLGYDANINNIFKLSKGDYVFLISDDDDFEPNSVNFIYKTINNFYKNNLIIFGSNFYDSKLKNFIDKDNFFKSFNSPIIFNNAEEFFKYSKVFFGGVSGVCISTLAWKNFFLSNMFGTNWIHMDVSLSIMIKNGLVVIPHSVVKYRQDNKDNRWNSIRTSLGIQKVLKKYLNKLPSLNDSMYKEHRHQTRLSFIGIEGFSNDLNYFERIYLSFKSFDLRRFSFWFIDLPIVIFPGFVTKRIYFFLSIFKNK